MGGCFRCAGYPHRFRPGISQRVAGFRVRTARTGPALVAVRPLQVGIPAAAAGAGSHRDVGLLPTGPRLSDGLSRVQRARHESLGGDGKLRFRPF